MKVIARSLVVVFVILIAVPALAVSYTITAAVQLLATTALIMGGTQHPLSTVDTDDFVNGYFDQAVDHFITPGVGAPDDTYAVIYPAEFFPVFGTTTFDDSVADGRDNLKSCLNTTAGVCDYNDSPGVDSPGNPPPTPTQYGGDLDNSFIVFGYSQSAVAASLAKQDLVDYYRANPTLTPPNTKFVLASNPMRGNGGILGRGLEGMTIPGLGITFYGETPNCTDGGPCFDTVDVAQQYDLLGGDAPARLDPLAFANSLAAYALLHGNVPTRSIAPGGTDPADPTVIYQDSLGDTDYYMITAPRLPLLMVFEQAGVPGPALALPDAILRVWIEDKYRRDLSPGADVDFQLSPIGNPISLIGNTLGAIPVGIDDTFQQAGIGRLLGTDDVYRPFGVGGQAYSKTTGLPVDDDSAPLNAFNSGPLNAEAPRTPEPPSTGDNAPAIKTAAAGVEQETDVDEIGNDVTPPTTTPPAATKPRPLELLRDSIKFDPPKLPSLRPNGEGPLTRIVKTLTGQRPTGADAETDNDAPSAADTDAPAA